ncbi:hypothetical protein IID04_04580, partial [PVC group bacterium]|nr:hypothetical protein [PVC group bacterium]
TYTPAESTYKLGLGYRQIDTGRQIVQDDFFGRSCHVYESKDSKYWVWNNLLLKEEIRIANRYLLTEVLEIQENIELDESLFEIPEHIVVISQEDYVSDVKNLAGSVMEKLKKEYGENEGPDTSAHTGEFNARQRDLWNKSMEYMASLMTEADQNKIEKIKNNSDLSEEEKLTAIEKIEITMRYKKQVFKETRSESGQYDIEKHLQMIDK